MEYCSFVGDMVGVSGEGVTTCERVLVMLSVIES